MLTLHLSPGGGGYLQDAKPGGAKGTAVSSTEPARAGTHEQLVNGERGVTAASPGPDAITVCVALRGRTLGRALGVREPCRQW